MIASREGLLPERDMADVPTLAEQARQDRAAALRRLIARIGQLAPIGDDRFEVPVGESVFDRIYGGHLLAEALMVWLGIGLIGIVPILLLRRQLGRRAARPWSDRDLEH